MKAEYVGYSKTLAYSTALTQNKPKQSALVDHVCQYHPEAVGQMDTCSVKVLRTFKKPLDRQIAEAVLIHRSGVDIVMNRKEE